MEMDGQPVGDSLSDKAYEDIGYRWHDVFHLSYAACLGWSRRSATSSAADASAIPSSTRSRTVVARRSSFWMCAPTRMRCRYSSTLTTRGMRSGRVCGNPRRVSGACSGDRALAVASTRWWSVRDHRALAAPAVSTVFRWPFLGLFHVIPQGDLRGMTLI
ncbi:hypothetical protein [Carbonactinospora thermoautotrophica]|uniref:hypothetical protein n=1 Tax=Carbonactinospora thermoautotrophica TaxID=1469144 RepID=UPI00355919DD